MLIIALVLGVLAFIGCIISVIRLAYSINNHLPKLLSSCGLSFCLILLISSFALPLLLSNDLINGPPIEQSSKVAEPVMVAVENNDPFTQGVINLLLSTIPEQHKSDKGKTYAIVSGWDTFDVYTSLEINTDDADKIKTVVANVCASMRKSEYKIRMLDFDIYSNGELWGTILQYDNQPGFTILQDGKMVESPLLNGFSYMPEDSSTSQAQEQLEDSSSETDFVEELPDIEVSIPDEPQEKLQEEAASQNKAPEQDAITKKEEIEKYLNTIIPKNQQVSRAPIEVSVSDTNLFSVHILSI